MSGTGLLNLYVAWSILDYLALQYVPLLSSNLQQDCCSVHSLTTETTRNKEEVATDCNTGDTWSSCFKGTAGDLATGLPVSLMRLMGRKEVLLVKTLVGPGCSLAYDSHIQIQMWTLWRLLQPRTE